MPAPTDDPAVRAQLRSIADLMRLGRLRECEERLDALVAKHPMHPVVLFYLGGLRWETGRKQEAMPYWRRSLAADPTFLPAMTNLSHALLISGDLREALRYAQMAVRRKPGDAGLLCNLATVFADLGKLDNALAALHDALFIDPAHQAARARLINVLEISGNEQGAIDEALILLQQPDQGFHLAALAAISNQGGRRSRWDLLDRYAPLFRQAVRQPTSTGISPMTMAFSEDDPELLLRLGRSESVPPMQATSSQSRWQGGRMTIGFLSPDLREHPVAQMLLPVLAAHDRSKVRIVLVPTSPMDDIPLTRRLRQHADAVLEVSGIDDGDACLALQKEGIDVLVDICGGTRWNRGGILARRPCQAQVMWLGCPVTTGAAYYDAFLVDGIVAPPGYEAWCSEPLLRLPCSYHPISCGLFEGASAITRADLKLPEGVVIVGLMQPPRKITPPFVDRVAATVAAIPGCHLALRVHEDAVAMAGERLGALGLPRERLHFLPRFPVREDYLTALRLVDLVVDTVPYGGHSTTGETLTQGTPVLACLGRSIHARVAASMLHELALDELIAPDLDASLAMLARYAADPAALRALRGRCAAAVEAYGAGGMRRLAGALEDAYAEVLRRNLPPG